MSAVTATHRDLTGMLRRHVARVAPDMGVDPEDVDVSRRVEHYHRANGYREIDVVTTRREVLVALWEDVATVLAADLRNVRVTPEIGPMYPGHGGWRLCVTIWKADAPHLGALVVRDPIPAKDAAADGDVVVWWLSADDARRLDRLVEAGLDVSWTEDVERAYRSVDGAGGPGRIVRAGDVPVPDTAGWPPEGRALADSGTGIALRRTLLPGVANLGGIVTDRHGRPLALVARTTC